MADDLDVIDPPGNTVTFAGRQVTIKPVTVGKLPEFSRAMKPVLPLVDKIDSLGSMPLEELLDLLADNIAPIVRLVSIASDIPEAELNAADPVSLLSLISPIVKVNADFFRLRLLLAGKLQSAAKSPGAGQTP